jgi:hypothetical protein
VLVQQHALEGNPIPVVQLQDQGGLGTLIGMAGGYLLGNPARKAAQADRQQKLAQTAVENKRADAAAADTHANIMSSIADRDATAKRTAANDTGTQLSQGAFQKYMPMLSSPPTVDGKPLKGPALANALYAIRNKAFTEGMTNDKNIADFNAEIARVTQANAPKIGDVEHGLPQPVTSGKKAWSPAQMANHYLADATTKVINSDMPDDQKKLYIANFQKIAEPYLKQIPTPAKPMTPYQQQQLEISRGRLGVEQQNANRPRVPREPGIQRNAQGLTPEDVITNAHWDAEHPKGGKPKTGPPGAGDWTTIKDDPNVKVLPPMTKTSLQQGVDAYGVSGAAAHLTNAIKTGKFPPGFNADSANAALNALNGNGN